MCDMKWFDKIEDNKYFYLSQASFVMKKRKIDDVLTEWLLKISYPFILLYVGIVWVIFKIIGKKFPQVE